MNDYNQIQLEKGITLQSNNQLDVAEKIYKQILSSDAKNFNALYLLGTIKAQKNENEEAIILIKKSLSINQNNFIAYSNLGLIYYNINKLEEAIIEYNNSILLNSKYSESYNGLGSVYLKQKKYLLAFANYKKADKINKKVFSSRLNIVKLLVELQKYKKAELILDKLLLVDPANYENYYIKGIINKRLGKLEVSKKNYLKSIELNPNHYLSYNEIGYVFYLNKDFENAYFYINKSITINRSFKEGFLNRGMINLLNGKFIEGWEDYCLGKDTKYPITKKSLWDGQLNLKNKSIFIYSEQGLGDVIQFTRYLFMLSNYFDKIIYKIPNSLKHLFSNINSVMNGKIELVTDFKKIDQCNFYLPLLNLALFFKKIPDEINYFNIDRELVNKWSKKINNEFYNIGICWKAGKKDDLIRSEFASERSFGLDQLAKILSLKDVMLINLQKEHAEDQKNNYYDKIKIFKEMDSEKPFLDTAAIIMNCNLVITCDTSIAHLAGTLGKKTFLLLNYNNHWVWGIDKNYSNWYKNIKIFRQNNSKSWDDPFNQVYDDIKTLL
jgi:tetratricopeptide (TPR) repeat protein